MIAHNSSDKKKKQKQNRFVWADMNWHARAWAAVGQGEPTGRERERGVLGRLLYSTHCVGRIGVAPSGRVELSWVEARRNWPQLCGKLCCKLSMEKKKKIRDTGVVRGLEKGRGGGQRLCAGFLCSFCVYNSGLSSSPLPFPQLRVHCAQSTAKASQHRPPPLPSLLALSSAYHKTAERPIELRCVWNGNGIVGALALCVCVCVEV